MNDQILVLDSGNFLAMTMADDALTEAGIPHSIVEFTKSGRSMEMPIAPSFGRGYHWQVSVSKEHRLEAEAILRLLPMAASSGPNPPDAVSMSPKAERWSTCYRVLSAAAIMGMSLLFYFLSR